MKKIFDALIRLALWLFESESMTPEQAEFVEYAKTVAADYHGSESISMALRYEFAKVVESAKFDQAIRILESTPAYVFEFMDS